MQDILQLKSTMTFCEENLAYGIAQPANSFSSFVFCIVGFIILIDYLKYKRKISLLFGLSSILIGIFSFVYHSTNSYVGEILDLSSMYILAGLCLTINLKKLYKLSNIKFILTFIFTVLISILLTTIFNSYSGGFVFALLIILALVSDLKLRLRCYKADYKFVFIGIILLLIAFTIWLLDVTKVLCDPQNHIINGHSIWHVINSISLYCFYRFYRKQTLSE